MTRGGGKGGREVYIGFGFVSSQMKEYMKLARPTVWGDVRSEDCCKRLLEAGGLSRTWRSADAPREGAASRC